MKKMSCHSWSTLRIMALILTVRLARRSVAAFAPVATNLPHSSKSSVVGDAPMMVPPPSLCHFSCDSSLFMSSSSPPSGGRTLSYLEGLNEAQMEAVTATIPSITRVVAGPGAGKTRVLTCRILHLLRSEGSGRILAVTFTKKAADEMQTRLNKMYEQLKQDRGLPVPTDDYGPHGIDRVTLGTFHSVCSKILRWNGQQLALLPTIQEAMAESTNATNLDGAFAILDQGDQLRLVKQLLKAEGIDLSKEKKTLKALTILNCFPKLKAGEVDAKQIRRNPAMRIADLIFPQYREHLYANNALDFDDLIFLTRELLETREEIRESMQRRWRHMLVDEFQDTSKLQLELVKLLSGKSLLVVGDADQSIYSWRGAHVESMVDFDTEFPGTETVYLMENYRSTTNIVRAAQKIIESSESGSANDLRQDMKPMRGSGPTPRILACANAKSEAKFVVNTILGKLNDGELTPDHTVAVLYRTNAQSRALEESCVENQLAYVVRGSAGAFYNRAEIKDALCFLRWMYNGRDGAAMTRAFKTPSRGIGEKSVQAFIAYCDAVDRVYLAQDISPRPSPLDLLRALTDDTVELIPELPDPKDIISTRALNRFLPFSELMGAMYKQAHLVSVSELLSFVIETVGLRDHLDSISKSTSEFEDRWNNLQELRQASQKKEGIALKPVDDEAASTPLGDYLDDIALVTDMMSEDDEEKENEQKILKANLMTIHSAKGMEFDLVFIVGNEEGTFPTTQAVSEGEGSVELDEERRLCYVAMTRAKNQLIMTWRREVAVFSSEDSFMAVVPKERSRFLNILTKQAPTGQKASGLKGAAASGSGGRKLKRRVKKKKKKKKKTTMKVEDEEPQLLSFDDHLLMMAGRLPKKTEKSIIPESHPMQSTVSMEKRVTRQERIDPAWIYPAGSSVIHTKHGQGKVMQSLPSSDQSEPMVRVRFDSGVEVDVAVLGKELFPN